MAAIWMLSYLLSSRKWVIGGCWGLVFGVFFNCLGLGFFLWQTERSSQLQIIFLE